MFQVHSANNRPDQAASCMKSVNIIEFSNVIVDRTDIEELY